jgi:hypothetical protein
MIRALSRIERRSLHALRCPELRALTLATACAFYESQSSANVSDSLQASPPRCGMMAWCG